MGIFSILALDGGVSGGSFICDSKAGPCIGAIGVFYTLERKTLGYGQVRKGPNKRVPIGLVQPLLDGFKLFIKGFKGVNKGSVIIFFGTSGLGLCGALVIW
ncbi:hypothetical protein GJ496_005359 [Pomphorhynchus laevis]|nr:hypothetical protein GJ496_005359 [Pomphorhynchus laevis]